MKMMAAKAVSTLVFILVLLVFFSLYYSAVDLRSHFSSLSLPFSPSLCRSVPAPLRVYMYDLPRRFNFEMIDHGRPGSPFMPPWPRNSGLKKQHSVEYWMMASLLYKGDADSGTEAVRVMDPETADAFFVPFFSSLSFNTHGHNMTDPETEVDRQLQIELLSFLRESEYWKRSRGRDHVIPMHHPNAFRFLRNEVNTSILIVADFGRLPKTVSNLGKDVVAPYVHVVDTFVNDDSTAPFESRGNLLFFRGRTVRKDEGVVRAKLAKVLVGHEDVHYENSFAIGDGIKVIPNVVRAMLLEFWKQRSIYINYTTPNEPKKAMWRLVDAEGPVCPTHESAFFKLQMCQDKSSTSEDSYEHVALGIYKSNLVFFCWPYMKVSTELGDTPSSCRLFDAIVSHCVPVIVSDRIELPYEDELDYEDFSIFFSIEEALRPNYMVNKLREVPKESWLDMWRRLKHISHHYEFQYPPKKDDAVNMLWRQVRHKLPAAKLAAHRSRRLKIPDWWKRR